MNAGVTVEALSLTLGAFRLKKLDFKLEGGEILVILGPNGAGKSVTLETIAGFHRPDSGRVLLDGRDVTRLPPEQRRVGFVVQNFGLFPHLSVAQNLAIARRVGRAAVPSDTGPPHDKPEALLSYFGISHLAHRAPAALSAGEKQRVALARALASAPDLFLFDEPFSALDAESRDQLREELKSFLRALAIPAIFVTHDHDDALALADTIVVLRDGTIVQTGPAAEIFRKPANSFVARFVGVENVLPGKLVAQSDGFFTLAVGERTLRAALSPNIVTPTASVLLAIRAEDVTISPLRVDPEPARAVNRLQGRIVGSRTIGPLVAVQIDCGFQLKAYLLAPQWRAMQLVEGSVILAELAPDDIHLMSE
jgi:molybdate/tungstate transport system ATP-binding protein